MSYKTIVADPAWAYKTTLAVTGNAPGRTPQRGRSGTNYPTMTVAEIAALPVSDLAAPDAHLYLWTTNTHVEHAWDVVRAWGFEPKNLLTWCKRPKGMIGFGVYSQSTEFVLFARRGTSIHLDRCETTWFEWARRAHSQKPEEFQDIVERVSPGPYLEMFARRRRLGWDVWGNEVESDVQVLAPQDVQALLAHDDSEAAMSEECPVCGWSVGDCVCVRRASEPPRGRSA